MEDDFTPTPIADLLDYQQFADKQTVMCVEGTLTKLFKVTRGSGSDGPYEFQNGFIEDETGEIKVTFANNTQPPNVRGQYIRLTCFKSPQHGWTGLKIEDRGYNDRGGNWVEERQLKITGTANIEFPQGMGQGGGGYEGGGGGGGRGGGGGGGRYQGGGQASGRTQQQGNRGGGGYRGNQQQRPPQQQQRREPQRPHNMAPQNQKPSGQLPHPRLILEDLIALHKDLHTIVNETYKAEVEAGLDTSPFLATIFIEAAKQGCVLDYKARAAKPPKKVYPPAPKDPSRWKECVLASGDFEGKTLDQVPDEYLKKLFTAFDEQGANHATAECVYKAVADKGLINPPNRPGADPDLDTAPDDIPF